ncbi:MAG TPA: FlgD immunoglobulin-like domain containing protein [Gaiellales bacterium]|nr:FlgD immunoglobulin-like domain containing protein [Gaiellales bacterium]
MSHHRAATALLLVIIAASAAAFLRAEQLKLTHSAVGHPHVRAYLSPGCQDPGCHRLAHMHFTLRDGQHLQLAIVRTDGTLVRTLADRTFAKGRVRAIWDGRDASGAVVADGTYHLRVTLAGGRQVTIPDPIVVDTKPVDVTIGKVHIGTAVVTVHYTRSDPVSRAELLVYKNGRLVVHKHRVIPRVAHFRIDAVGPGQATIEIVAVDRAGNRTPNPPKVTVTLP